MIWTEQLSAACCYVVCVCVCVCVFVVLFGTDVGHCSVRNGEKQRNGNGREYMKVRVGLSRGQPVQTSGCIQLNTG
jgi:hypothetical protein